ELRTAGGDRLWVVDEPVVNVVESAESAESATKQDAEVQGQSHLMMTVFPNPGPYNLRLEGDFEEGVWIRVLNMEGKEIRAFDGGGAIGSGGKMTEVLDLAGFADGIYIVQADNGKQMVTQKIIKR
ncbi:MAG: T9SS type A sorting domain-containing protein, partial [Bacteroidota bacterium]